MSISIVNRGGVSSSSGGGPSGGLKPELTVVAPSGSKLEISTGGSGGSANGDGMALYNGVMLPKIPVVDGFLYSGMLRSGIVYAVILSDNPLAISASGQLVATKSGTVCVCGYNSDVSPDYEIYSPYPVSAGDVVVDLQADSVDTNWGWANYDLLLPNNAVYLAASDPIPLEGMNVITWDGDTTGKETSSNGAYFKVSDEIIDPTAYDKIVVAVMMDGVLMAAQSSGSQAVAYDNVYQCGLDAFVQSGGGSMNGITFNSPGVYFFKGEFDTGLMQETHFAYPASSGGDKQIVDTYTLGENETEHTFTVDLGTYTVTGTLGSQKKETVVKIDVVGKYTVELNYS